MKLAKRSAIGFVLIVLLLNVACAHRTGSTDPVTPWEKVVTANALLAETNNSVEKGVELCAQQNLINVSTAADVLRQQAVIARAHKQLTAILAKGQGALGGNDTAAIKLLIDQIKSSAKDMIGTGAIGVKNPNSQVAISAEVEAVANLADLIVSNLQAAGVLK